MESKLLIAIDILRKNNYIYIGHTNEYVDSNSKVVCLDLDGYFYLVKPSVIKRGKTKPNKVDPSNPYSIHNINTYLNLNNKGFCVIDEEYIHSSKDLKCVCTKDKNHGVFYKNWGQIGNKGMCPKCHDFKKRNHMPDIVESVFFLRNDLVKYFKNEDDAKLYKIKSNKKIELVCPECGKAKKVTIDKLTSRGFRCSYCSDGVSMPEKIMINILNELNLKFEVQKKFEWATDKYYDFYVNELNMIIETHGIQHYHRQIHPNGRTVDEEIENDLKKKQLALDNGIKNYVEINCSNITFESFNNVYSSELKNVFDLSCLNWGNIWRMSLKSNVVEASRMFSDGVEIDRISEILGVHRGTVIVYLNQGSKIKLCNYSGLEQMKKSAKEIGKRNGVPVSKFDLDMNFIEEYSSFTEAGDRNNLCSGSIVYASNVNKSFGGYYWIRKIKGGKDMSKIVEFFKRLQNTSSKNEKEEILSEIKSGSVVDEIIRFLFDSNQMTGIKRAKLNKYLGRTINGDTSKYAGDWLELLEYFEEHKTGREEDINYLINTAKFTKGYLGDGESDLMLSVICKDLKLGCGATTYNKAHPDNPVFDYKVMGGKAYEEERARKMVRNGEVLYFTEKIDGNRGTRDMYTDNAMVSRNGKVWDGTDSILNELNQLVHTNRVPEGEFVYHDTTGKMTSQELRAMTTSIMNDKKILDKAEAGIVFKIFDIPKKVDFNEDNTGEPYSIRRAIMDDQYVKQIKEMRLKYIQIIPVEFTVSTEEELVTVMPRLKQYINEGHEGYMCISSVQPYKTGKGHYLMKLKNILSADLKIVGWNYGKEKTKWEGKFASFTVEFPYVDKKGVKGIYQVDVGSGYSDEFRNKVNKNPDEYIGKILEIIITEVSKNKDGGYSLSYARMVEVREDKNTIDLEKHSLVELDGELFFKED